MFQIDEMGIDEERRECRIRCIEDMSCRFYYYSISKTCILYTSCDQLRTTHEVGTTISIAYEGIVELYLVKDKFVIMPTVHDNI